MTRSARGRDGGDGRGIVRAVEKGEDGEVEDRLRGTVGCEVSYKEAGLGGFILLGRFSGCRVFSCGCLAGVSCASGCMI